MTSKIAYEKSHFISLIGEGASSALVPFLGYLQRFGEPLSAVLLPTRHTAQWVPGLESQIRELSPEMPVKVVTISSGFGDDDADLPKVEKIYAELESELGPLAINMMGGMKMAGLAGLLSLKSRHHVFLQISDERLIISRLVDDTVHTESLVMEATLTAKKLLELQRIDYHPDPDPPRNLAKLCHEAGLPLPRDALCEMIVGGHRVDCLWSAENNVLHLLLISPPHFKDSSEALYNARRIETLANTKNWTNGLFSKKIIVLDTEARNVERYELEAAGLIHSHKVDWRDDILTHGAKEILKTVFNPSRPSAPAVIHKPALKLDRAPTLITSMGRLSDATLLTIAAHGRPQVVLLHTPDDEWVSAMVKIYQTKARELGVKKVVALPTDFTAANVHAHLPASLARHAEVNVTPGTKTQGTALGLWAKCHGVPAWALCRDTIRRIDGVSQSRPVPPLSVKTRLDLTLEVPITDYGWGVRSHDWADAFYDRLLKLMNILIDKDLSGLFLRADFEIEGFKMTLTDPEQRHWRFHWPADDRGPSGCRDLKDGFWYERLTAKAVHSLNKLNRASYDVSCGVEVSPPNRPERFLTERDVLVATSKAQLFMISCKTAGRFKSNVYKRILSEVEAMAKTLGRFVIPILCDMTPEAPKMSGDVLVMGWTTLCKPDRLQAALEMAANQSMANPRKAISPVNALPVNSLISGFDAA